MDAKAWREGKPEPVQGSWSLGPMCGAGGMPGGRAGTWGQTSGPPCPGDGHFGLGWASDPPRPDCGHGASTKLVGIAVLGLCWPVADGGWEGVNLASNFLLVGTCSHMVVGASGPAVALGSKAGPSGSKSFKDSVCRTRVLGVAACWLL